ncbi:MAG: sigma-70 family RNA polymerase sigma factor [Acidobacteriota bacterium]|nr:sigma-70 family RNA polymerase sigma factor [Acidobacteriota bacterium]
MTDQQLVDRFLDNDTEAFQQIDDWIRAASRSFRFRLGDHWEDAQQEIRLEVMRLLRRKSFQGRSSLKTYVWKVVCHSCIDYLRKQHSKTFTTLENLGEKEAVTADPLDSLSQSDTAKALLGILQKVPEECRNLWRMILAGLPYAQMAGSLGISEATTRVRVHRCRQKAAALREKAGI